MGDTISAYYGEFLIVPTPLEMSFNYCSHKCAYCFANLNTPDRKADIKTTMAIIANHQTRNTLEAKLLREGYPTLISNRVDPFAKSNYKQALPVMHLMNDMGLRIAIQTKGGDGDIEIAEAIPPSHWYISVSFTDDGKRKIIEPGAPSIPYRYELIKKLVAMGHIVSVGINPCIPEWFTEYEEAINHMNEIGVSGYWVEPLHFSLHQIEAMTDKEKVNMGQVIINNATGDNYKKSYEFIKEVTKYIRSTGKPHYTSHMSDYSLFFENYRKVYPKTFPINQDWVNWCWNNKKQGEILTFDEYWNVLKDKFPTGSDFSTQSYFRVQRRLDFMRGKEHFPNRSSYLEVIKHHWKESKYSKCPANIPSMSYAVKDGKPILDDKGLPVMIYAGNDYEWEDLYQETEW